MDPYVARILQEANDPTFTFYESQELLDLGFKRVGKNVQVSRLARFYKFSGFIGDHSRIDDFCVLKGEVRIGDYVHISSFAQISAVSATIDIQSFVGISTHFSCYSSTDDYRADKLNNPTLPKGEGELLTGDIRLGLGAVIGAHCLILPSVNVGDGASIGAGCIVHQNVPAGGILRAGRSRLSGRVRNVQTLYDQAKRIWKGNSP